MGTVKKWQTRKLKCASQAEILRSHQRDGDFVKNLRQKLSEILHNLGVHRPLFHYIQSDIPLKLVYFIFTSGMGNQTLGEEYTGIVQANLEACKVPTLTVRFNDKVYYVYFLREILIKFCISLFFIKVRVLAAILECLGERMLLKLLGQCQAYVNRPDSELTPAAITFFNNFLSKLRTMIPIIVLFHKGIFYIYGRYYSLGRRIVGLDHTKVKP